MSKKLFLSTAECLERAKDIATTIAQMGSIAERQRVYGIPRGGVPVSYLLLRYIDVKLVDDPDEADVFVDDLIDSGNTRDRFAVSHPSVPFLVLYDKTGRDADRADRWFVFPWEAKEEQSEDNSIVGTITNRLRKAEKKFAANDCIAEYIQPGELKTLGEEVTKRADALLRALIIDVDNDHNTKGTALRIAKMYLLETMRGRYYGAPSITEFPNVRKLDELYTVGPMDVRSLCSHHMQPVIGRAWVGVIPGRKLIGLSKFSRVLRWFASRPQIQEELIVQVADHLEELTDARGLAVVIEATHGCMTCRGVRESTECMMTNSVMRGAFRTRPEARAEFMALIGK